MQEDEHFNMFIYGAMKRGEPDHSWLEDEAHGLCKFISTGTTIKIFPMVLTKPFNAPVVLNEPGIGNVRTNSLSCMSKCY